MSVTAPTYSTFPTVTIKGGDLSGIGECTNVTERKENLIGQWSDHSQGSDPPLCMCRNLILGAPGWLSH